MAQAVAGVLLSPSPAPGTRGVHAEFSGKNSWEWTAQRIWASGRDRYKKYLRLTVAALASQMQCPLSPSEVPQSGPRSMWSLSLQGPVSLHAGHELGSRKQGLECI